MAARALGREIARDAAEESALEVGGRAVGYKKGK